MNICFSYCKLILTSYTDAEMARDIDSRKSTSGYLVTFAEGAPNCRSISLYLL